MAKKIKIEINHAGVEQMLRGQGEFSKVRDELVKRAESLAAKAGPGYEVKEFQGHDRLHVQVGTGDEASMVSEAVNHNLARALGQESGQSLNVYTSKAGRQSIRTDAEVANYTRNKRA